MFKPLEPNPMFLKPFCSKPLMPNLHLSYLGARVRDSNNLIDSPRWANYQDLNRAEAYETPFFLRPQT